jgi:hypothetical protein
MISEAYILIRFLLSHHFHTGSNEINELAEYRPARSAVARVASPSQACDAFPAN